MLKKKCSKLSRVLLYGLLVVVVTITFASAGKIVNVAFTAWDTHGNTTWKIKGYTSGGGPAWVGIWFSDVAWVACMDDGLDEFWVSGLYTTKKGKLKKLHINTADLESNYFDVFGEYTYVTKAKAKAKAKLSKKSGYQIKYDFKSKFIVGALNTKQKFKSMGGLW